MIRKGNGRQPDNICYLFLIILSPNKTCDCYRYLVLIDLSKKIVITVVCLHFAADGTSPETAAHLGDLLRLSCRLCRRRRCLP